MATAHDVIQMFGSVEDDQKYGRLVEFVTDDAIYCDPFAGPQRGKAAITEFMAEMERVIPKMGVYFADWETVADTTVGWSRWTMVVPVNGVEHPIPGQSLYRLRDGKVCYAADYVDSAAYRKLRPEVVPDLLAASREPKGTNVAGSAASLVHTFWEMQTSARYAELSSLFADDSVFTDQVFGRFEGIDAVRQYLTRMETEMPESGATFTLDDHAGDETVAWSQWTCHLPNGSFPGWTLHSVSNGKFTLDADYFDVVAARKLQRPHDPR
jgi:ketosteroid isomerase-like protein